MHQDPESKVCQEEEDCSSDAVPVCQCGCAQHPIRLDGRAICQTCNLEVARINYQKPGEHHEA